MATFRERNGKWQAIVRLKKHGTIIHQESRTFDTERLAKDWAGRLERKVRTEGAPSRPKATMADLIGLYREARESVKPLRRAMAHELAALEAAVGSWRLSSLDPGQVAAYARARRAEGAGPTTVLHNLATLRAVLNTAKPLFGLDVDGSAVSAAITALEHGGFVGRSTHRDRRVSQDEIDALVREFERIAAHPSTEIPMAAFVRLAVALPRRREELCNLQWADYDGRVAVLRDTKHPRKPRVERVPVPPEARKIIDTLPRFDARVLPYKPESISAAFQRACARLNLQDLHLHDLRHEGISRLFEQGLAIEEVALISGHTSWNMLRRYTHLRPEHVWEKLSASS